MRDARALGRVLGAALAATLLAGAPATAQSPGADGVGDPYFPKAGNGGYQVEHYELRMRVKPRRSRVAAVATISAEATQALSSFNLDFRGLRITSVLVDGAPASILRRGGELTVTPASPIASGADFTAVVAYRGHPRPIRMPDGFRVGWLRTDEGTVVASEPRGAPGWFPCNDHPTDKATYSFLLTVPRGRRAIANGTLQAVRRSGKRATFAWEETAPMATYLATVATGRFRLKRGRAAGIPSLSALDPRQARRSRRPLRRQGRIISRFASIFGPYPFDVTGAIVDHAPYLAFALETQTRSLFFEAPGTVILGHEMAHQWFGDAVSLERWSDIWLNEGFATWAEWLWQKRAGGLGPAQMFRLLYRLGPSLGGVVWNPPPGRPGVKRLFAPSVYLRGGMTLEALRRLVGAPTFHEILRRWVADHLYGNASSADFIALAESVSGRDLDHFFQIWLYTKGKPRNWS